MVLLFWPAALELAGSLPVVQTLTAPAENRARTDSPVQEVQPVFRSFCLNARFVLLFWMKAGTFSILIDGLAIAFEEMRAI